MKRISGLLFVLLALMSIVATIASGEEGLRIDEAVLCADVTDRSPQSPAESFKLGERVYCWCRILGGKPGDFIYHVWFHEGREIQSVELAVTAERWRTWSYKTLFPGLGGSWRVEIQSAQGVILGSYDFSAEE